MWPSLHPKRAVIATAVMLTWVIVAVLVLLWNQLNSRPDFCKRPYETVCAESRSKSRLNGRAIAQQIWVDLNSNNPTLEDEELRELFAGRVFTPERIKSLVDAFQWTRDALRDWVLDAPEAVINTKDKQTLVYRINQIRLEDPSTEGAYSTDPYLLFADEIQYVRYDNGFLKIRFGGAYILGEPERINLIYSLAHEMAHSVDPCELSRTQTQVSAFKPLEACFREKHWFNEAAGDGCGERPHLAELFSDWMATQLITASVSELPLESRGAALRAAVGDLCYAVGPTHPAPEIRIGNIVGKNPGIREALGCGGAQPQYCGL